LRRPFCLRAARILAVKRCDNVYLVGMMGAGKTTIGRALARRLKKTFVDADHEIESRTGVRIPVIFDIEGEEGFRRREAQVLQQLTEESAIVLATGGGAVLNPENRRCLARSGVVIYLDVPPDVLWDRLRHDNARPLLKVPDPRGRIEGLYRERDPLYREVADLVVAGGREPPNVLLKELEREIRKRCAP
jgi:shikimate kinase